MVNLSELFTQIEAFVDQAEAKAADALTNGSAWLRTLADWVDAQKDGLVNCTADDIAKANSLLPRVKKCCKPDTGIGRQTVGANGALFLTLLQLAMTFLQEFLKNQPTT